MFGYLKVRRIKHDLTEAAKKGRLYHLWWHPHNFALKPEASLAQLSEVLYHFKKLRQQYGFESYSMHEVSNILAEIKKGNL